MKKILFLILICLFVFAYCKSPADPGIKNVLNPENPSTINFSGYAYMVPTVYGRDNAPDIIVLYWRAFVINMTTCEAGIIQADKFIYHWDGDLYETEKEMPVIWTGTSYYDPSLVLPLTHNVNSPSAYLWEETDADIPHPGYLPNRVKVVFHVESEGKIYILETKLKGITWR